MNAEEKLDRLETWATLAAEAMQQVCDEAQDAAGDPDGASECRDLRVLIEDLDRILVPEWQQALAGAQAAGIAALDSTQNPVCPACKGSGANPMSDIVEWMPCTRCGGKGALS